MMNEMKKGKGGGMYTSKSRRRGGEDSNERKEIKRQQRVV
jgi:hypothetical protein